MIDILFAASGNYKWQYDLVVWSIVVFALILLVLGPVLLGPIRKMLAAREDAIVDQLQSVDIEQAKFDAAAQEIEDERLLMRQKANEIVEEAKRDCKVMIDEMKAKTKSDISKLESHIDRDIQMNQDRVMFDLWHMCTLESLKVAETELRDAFSSDQQSRLIDSALDDLETCCQERG